MKEIVQNGNLDQLDVIVNPKVALGKDIIQLETAGNKKTNMKINQQT